MFEDQTFEAIMERMLNSISADIDTREGSVIYNALAPAAAELAKSYIWLDTVLELVFSDTAQGEFLDRRAAEAELNGQPPQRRSERESLHLELLFLSAPAFTWIIFIFNIRQTGRSSVKHYEAEMPI